MICFWRKELWCVVVQSFRGSDFGFPRPGDLPLPAGDPGLALTFVNEKRRCSLVYPYGSTPLPSPLPNLSSSNFPGSIFIFHPGNHTFEHMHTNTLHHSLPFTTCWSPISKGLSQPLSVPECRWALLDTECGTGISGVLPPWQPLTSWPYVA